MGEELKLYVGCKIIEAKEMDLNEFERFRGKPVSAVNQDGYLVVYPDSYESWSPKEVFEIAYRLITVGEIDLLR